MSKALQPRPVPNMIEIVRQVELALQALNRIVELVPKSSPAAQFILPPLTAAARGLRVVEELLETSVTMVVPGLARPTKAHTRGDAFSRRSGP